MRFGVFGVFVSFFGGGGGVTDTRYGKRGAGGEGEPGKSKGGWMDGWMDWWEGKKGGFRGRKRKGVGIRDMGKIN